jgi:integration host factor subunit beta
MTKADLVERVTAQISRTAGPMISKKDCARVVDSFLDAIKEALQEQKNIEVRGFGTFKDRLSCRGFRASRSGVQAEQGASRDGGQHFDRRAGARERIRRDRRLTRFHFAP